MPDKKGSDDRAYARGFAAGRAAERAATDELWRAARAFINWHAEGPCGCDGEIDDQCDSCRALGLLALFDGLPVPSDPKETNPDA